MFKIIIALFWSLFSPEAVDNSGPIVYGTGIGHPRAAELEHGEAL